MTTKSILPSPFTVTPTYKSKNGTGRRCASIQGWELSPHWSYRGWYGSKKDATADAVRHYESAHSSDPQTLSRVRHDYLDWLSKVWPESETVKAAKVIEDERVKAEAKAFNEKAERDAKRAALAKAAPALLTACEAVAAWLRHPTGQFPVETANLVNDALDEAKVSP